MSKLFAVFGIICVLEPQNGLKERCFNFWEEPVQHYQNRKICDARALKLGTDIEDKFAKQQLHITKLEIYCIPTKDSNT